MIGAEPPQLQHREARAGAVVLAVKDLSLAKDDPFGTSLEAISFEVRAGEVVGIAGVSGNGQQELMRGAFRRGRARAAGLDPPVRQRHRPRRAAPAPPRRACISCPRSGSAAARCRRSRWRRTRC